MRNRHVATTCLPKSPGSASLSTYQGPSRVRVACDACRLHKLKCTGRQPRLRCVKAGRECYFAGAAKSSETCDDDQGHVASGDGLSRSERQEEEEVDDGDNGGEPSPSMPPTSNTIQQSPITIALEPNTSHVHINNDSKSPIHRPGEVHGWDNNNEVAPGLQPSLSLSLIDPSANSSAQTILSHPSNMEGLYYHTPRQSFLSSNLSLDVPRDLDWWLDSVPFDDSLRILLCSVWLEHRRISLSPTAQH